MFSNKVEQLKHSGTVSVGLMNLMSYCDKLQFQNLKEMKTTFTRPRKCHSLFFKHEAVIKETICLLSYLHFLINFPSFSKMGVIHTLSVIAFSVE